MQCTGNIAQNFIREISVGCAANMFSGSDFLNQLESTRIPADKVCRIMNNIGHQIAAAIYTVGQKVVHYYRILHQIHGIKNVITDVAQKISSS